MLGNDSPLVSIVCESYNHEKYLRDCLDGFVMQKTNFSYEILIHDDASTDHSQEIIKEYCEKYPHLFKPILQKENQYSKGVKIWHSIQFPRAKGKYVALCEGDDYWTDPFKLQKQINLLESNQDASMCYHACKNIFEEDNEKDIVFGEYVSPSYGAQDIIWGYPFQTATVVLRKDVISSNIYKNASQTNLNGDVIVFLTAAYMGKLIGINEQMSVYRRHKAGVSNNNSLKGKYYKKYNTWNQLDSIYEYKFHTILVYESLYRYLYLAYEEKNWNDFLLLLVQSIIDCPSVIKNTLPYFIKATTHKVITKN